MTTLPLARMRDLERRLGEIEAQMAEGPGADVYVRLASEHAELEPVVTSIRNHAGVAEEIAGLRTILADAGTDAEMRALAEAELSGLEARQQELEREIQLMLLPRDAADDRSAIVEIRAGTGGNEAALFAGDLFRMYARYGAARGWTVEVMGASEGEAGGYREIVASVVGRGVFARLKFESGVHRVQRVPRTESGGRIHTSAATVAVLPEAREIDIEVRGEDIRIDTMRASGAGGQHVNTTDSAVRITHVPTGIVVTQTEKSQHRNRARAMRILRARLYDLERRDAERRRAADRRGQIGSGDRSERIRTYNFPQGRVTDHRVNLTLYSLDRLLEGELDAVIDVLAADRRTKQLACRGESSLA